MPGNVRGAKIVKKANKKLVISTQVPAEIQVDDLITFWRHISSYLTDQNDFKRSQLLES
jgi:ribosome maturation factor RimP